MTVALRFVGTVKSPFATVLDAPRQGFLTEKESILVIDAPYVDALAGLEAGQDILVLFWGHFANRDFVQSPGGTGAFTGRSLHRPNPIGVSLAHIVGRDARSLTVTGLDAVDGSPIVDIKPARPEWEGNLPFIGLDLFQVDEEKESPGAESAPVLAQSPP